MVPAAPVNPVALATGPESDASRAQREAASSARPGMPRSSASASASAPAAAERADGALQHTPPWCSHRGALGTLGAALLLALCTVYVLASAAAPHFATGALALGAHARDAACGGERATAGNGTLLPRPTQRRLDFRVVIATFRRHDITNALLAELFASDLTNFTFEVVVFSNNVAAPFVPDARLPRERLAVIHTARSPVSWGQLVRDWNSALILGFQDLDAPISEVVVVIQGDELVQRGWARALWDAHHADGLIFFTAGAGDALLSWTAAGVKSIGIFDEFFGGGAGLHEADYFLRAVIAAPASISINDVHHVREHGARPDVVGRVLVAKQHDGDGDPRFPSNGVIWNKRYFHKKWPQIRPTFWVGRVSADMMRQEGANGIEYVLAQGRAGLKPAHALGFTYTFFELAISDRAAKGYML